MDFCATDHMLMMKYDGARITGKNELHGWTVDTRYGGAYITNLSTGLKTLLNLRYIKEMPQYAAIDITEAGENILIDIFEHAVTQDVPVILRHADLPEFSGKKILVDDQTIATSKLELASLIRAKE